MKKDKIKNKVIPLKEASESKKLKTKYALLRKHIKSLKYNYPKPPIYGFDREDWERYEKAKIRQEVAEEVLGFLLELEKQFSLIEEK